MLNLTSEQIKEKIDFVNQYKSAKNAADASKVDANANVSSKNIATMSAEINKDINIQINRRMLYEKITELYWKELADEFIRQVESHEIYVWDESSLMPYCVSITMYPFLLDGLTKLWGESVAPKHINSFCWSFVNLVFATSSQFAWAVATVEFLMYFDYFARKDYGDDYLNTHKKEISNHLQHVVYALNQPRARRGYQSVFWNISIYDKYYFDSMFGNFVFPDGTSPKWSTVKGLQMYFMDWFNKERTKALLTFPVVTAAMLSHNDEPKDEEFSDMLSLELSKWNSFFIYMSDNADSLSSCCRLRNEVADNSFSYTLWAGGVSTGSIKVMTLNLNRITQLWLWLKEQIQKLHKYHIAYRKIMEEFQDAWLLTVYSAGFISMKKQYSTIWINGLAEAAEFKWIKVWNNDLYKKFVQKTLKVIFDENKKAKDETWYLFNTEMVPAENLWVKNAKWDKKDGLKVERDVYNSYFYIVEDEDTNVVDKFVLHGKEIVQYLDWGSALHLNLENYLNPEGYRTLINLAAKTWCNYFCTNTKVTSCRNCWHIDKKTLTTCPKCGSWEVDWATRIIWYLKCIKSFSSARQTEEWLRFYHDKNEDVKTEEKTILKS